jgi:hypothetical protein
MGDFTMQPKPMAHVTGLELAVRLRAGGGSCLFCWSPVRHRLPSPPRAAELGITNVPEKPSAEADIMAFIAGLGG